MRRAWRRPRSRPVRAAPSILASAASALRHAARCAAAGRHCQRRRPGHQGRRPGRRSRAARLGGRACPRCCRRWAPTGPRPAAAASSCRSRMGRAGTGTRPGDRRGRALQRHGAVVERLADAAQRDERRGQGVVDGVAHGLGLRSSPAPLFTKSSGYEREISSPGLTILAIMGVEAPRSARPSSRRCPIERVPGIDHAKRFTLVCREGDQLVGDIRIGDLVMAALPLLASP